MDSATMLDFRPEHEDHHRVPWAADLEQIVIQLPAWVISLLTHNDAPAIEQLNEVANLQPRVKPISQLQSAFQKSNTRSLALPLVDFGALRAIYLLPFFKSLNPGTVLPKQQQRYGKTYPSCV
ncbi:hypothetical protein BJ165DRAFT_1594997 [Panaeolus papilionaceus]|nr:hypothetical protein BJ165DRAFT_1594997 [Panaeolus papilionaceus]